MKIINKKILNLFTLCILIIVPFLKFFSMNLEMFGILNNYDYINPSIVLYISIPFLLFVYINDIFIKKRKLDIYDYLFYILLITGFISVVFSVNKSIAILGKEFRHEGYLSMISYYLLFINWKENGSIEDIKKYIKLLVIIGILNCIYAILQIYTPFNFIIRYELDNQMASGLCVNPNFFGSFIVTIISIVACNFLMNKKITIKEVLLLILLFVSLINAQSTGPILTFLLVIVFLIIVLKNNNKLIKKNIVILFSILLITYTSVYFINKIVYKLDRCEMCELRKTLETGGTGRLKIWENSLKIVKDYPIVGIGFDNFYLKYPNPKIENSISLIVNDGKILSEERNGSILIFDNAHNVYLHTLVSTGILGLIPYLLLCLFTFIKGLKQKNKLGLLLLSGFVAYSIQAFANISVIQVAPIYYIIIGLILSIDKELI